MPRCKSTIPAVAVRKCRTALIFTASFGLTTLSMPATAWSTGCSGPPPTATPVAAPATRVVEVPVTVETPVTREVTVTRTVPVTVPVPVTRLVPSVREVTVTRIVPATVTVPVTREVPVTRIVTATPPPHTPTPDATAAAPPPTVIVATPMPTPASARAAAIAPAPAPEPESELLISVGNWQIYAKTYGDHTIAYAENQAIRVRNRHQPAHPHLPALPEPKLTVY